jgi:hypothetical protein
MIKMQEESNTAIFQRDILEFVTVAVQFCAYLESVEQRTRRDLVDTLLKLLPLLYLKGALLPDIEPDDSIQMEDHVSEENYNIIRTNVAVIMAEHDDYLDVFVEDMRFSDEPVLATVSENLADIYQDLKNFVQSYRDGVDETRQEAAAECRENFKHYWGQRAVNVMRVLHEVRYNVENQDSEEDF